MQRRLQRICGQVIEAGPCSGAAAVADKEARQEAARQEARRVRLQYQKDIVDLQEKGIPLKYTVFDLGILTDFQAAVPPRKAVKAMLEAADKAGRLELAKRMPGPMQDIIDDQEKQIDLVCEMALIDAQGVRQYHLADLMRKYGDKGLSSNICIPVIATGGWGPNSVRELDMRVLLGNPKDAERVMRVHLKKDPIIQQSFMDSIISTTDIDNWREQRNHLGEAFLPLASLSKIMPTSLTRAKFCAERLEEESQDGKNQVDMSNFFLHETMAQLMLALLGSTTEEMEKSNSALREAFDGRSRGPRAAKAGSVGEAMELFMKNVRENPNLSLPSEQNSEIFKGPLSRAIFTAEKEPEKFTHTANYGNTLLILFAGHDTTGHTMTWVLFELVRHPEIMRAVQEEVDELFDYLDGKDPTYQDLYRLTLMSKCITEAMRLWPVVPTVGWRQLQFADFVQGLGGEEVQLPRDTRTGVLNWSRHRNPDLWGPDVDEFNPNREFKQEEINSVGGPRSAINPQSERFSPFAYGPRSCLGKNFAQMEMRLILAYILHKFDFSLAGSYEKLMTPKSFPSSMPTHPDEFHALDRGTMGPMDLDEWEDKIWGKRHLVGMKMHAKARARAAAGVSA